jgi:multidrug resistance efflux pump
MSDSPRSYRLLVALGLGALAVAVGGFVLLSRQSPAGEPAPSPSHGVQTRVRAPGVVSFGRVDLRHGPAALAPLQPGRVLKILVQENELVSAGTPLLVVDDSLVRPRVRAAQAAVRAARAQLEKAQPLPAQHRARLAQQRSAIAALEQRVAAARTQVALKKRLRDARSVSAEDLGISQAQLKEAQALQEVETKKLVELELADPAADVRAAQAELEGAEARLAEAQQALAECTLKAPSAGTVLRILATPGDVVAGPARPAVVCFAPTEQRIVRAEVEQEFADQVAVGQRVAVHDEATGRLLCHGKATSLSDWYTTRRVPLMEPTRFNTTRTLECLITLDAGHPPLRLGQRVSVHFGTAP